VTTGSCNLAGLSTRGVTRTGMADALTRVLTTRHTGAAWLATRDSFDVTRKVLSLLMAPVAGFHSEGCARRAMLLAVAAVGDRMVASVRAVADPGTFRRSDSTSHWRIDHSCTAATPQLVETDMRTLGTFSTVARFLAPVKTAGEELAAGERAGMLDQDAAVFAALVPAAASFGFALLPTSCIISSGGQLGAGHLLVHVPASTSDYG